MSSNMKASYILKNIEKYPALKGYNLCFAYLAEFDSIRWMYMGDRVTSVIQNNIFFCKI